MGVAVIPAIDPKVADIFDGYDADIKAGLLRLRRLIFEMAADTPKVGHVAEVLRWGQPSYITPVTKSGSTIRLGVPKTGGFALYTHCQTTLISDFAATFPAWDQIDGNRAVLFKTVDDIDPHRHGLLIKAALTYHLK